MPDLVRTRAQTFPRTYLHHATQAAFVTDCLQPRDSDDAHDFRCAAVAAAEGGLQGASLDANSYMCWMSAALFVFFLPVGQLRELVSSIATTATGKKIQFVKLLIQ